MSRLSAGSCGAGRSTWALGALLAIGLACGAARPEERPTRSTKANYLLKCSGCHRADGAGAPAAGIPAFANSVGTLAALERGRLYLMHVPGVDGSGLDDAAIAALMNYVIERFAAASPLAAPRLFDADEVAALRAQTVTDVVALRRQLVADLLRDGIAVALYPWP